MTRPGLVCAMAGVLPFASYGAGPQFEVASVKLAAESARPDRNRIQVDGAQVRYSGVPLSFLVMTAYRLKRLEQLEGPAWISWCTTWR